MEYYAAYTNERGGVLGADGGLFAKHGSVNESWCRRVCVVPRHVWEKRGDRIFYTVLYAKKKSLCRIYENMVILASFWKTTRRPGEEGGSVLKVCVFTAVEIFNHRKRLCVNIQLALEQWGFMAVKNPRVNFRLPQNLTIKSLLEALPMTQAIG